MADEKHNARRIANTINYAGYDFAGKDRHDAALSVLELNTRLFPGAFNTWDSLAEAYMKRGDTKKAIDFYKYFVVGTLYPTNAKTAEMVKLVENASRDNQIAFANELSIICDKAGINVWDMIALANKHPRVNILNPGTGVGGHCIAVDPWFIVSEFPEESGLIKKSRETGSTNFVLIAIMARLLVYILTIFDFIFIFSSSVTPDP